MLLEVILGLIVLFLLKKFLYSNQNDSSATEKMPGLDSKSADLGNLEDIGKFGSLHKFLLYLHNEYGDIASFWFGPQRIVSICTADMFKELQAEFDRPPILFKLFEPFIGEKSIQLTNKDDGKNRRRNYDKKMSHQSMMRYINEFNIVSQEIISELMNQSSCGVISHNFTKHMIQFALKVDLLTMFGNIKDKSKIEEFHKNYNVCWDEMESRLGGQIPEPDSERELNFQAALENAKNFVREVVKERENMHVTEDNDRLIDILMDISPDEETLLSDAITYVVGGFHTTANSLTWGFYYIASHREVQEKLHAEIVSVIGDSDISFENINKCKYLRQVFDETLRCSVLAPFAARVIDDKDIILRGYPIAAGTPIVFALGVSLQNENLFPRPDVFDPQRFSIENAKSLPKFGYQPFGVGKRMCPGYRFAILEAAVCIATIIRKFELSLVDPEKDIEPVYGFVTHPSDDIVLKLYER